MQWAPDLAALLTVATILVGWNMILPVARTSHSGGAIVGYARVIDGDTLDLSGARIRLHGIDAPESTRTCTIAERVYRCGEWVTQALADLVRGQALRCDPLGLDPYRRTIGRCKIESTGQDIESWMVRQGYAVAYTHYSYAYVHDELVARISGRGLWAGTFEWPWDYRHEARDRR
jgi:endonuclease YncB( thermonuclease family)